MICRNCGDEYPDYKDYCPSCGTSNPQTSYNPQYSRPEGSGTGYNNGYYQQNPNQGYGVSVYYERSNRGSDIHYDEHVSVGGWIGRWFLMCLPIVNIIMLFVWAFGGTRQYSLKTWARAQLLLTLIGILITVTIVVIMIVLGFNFASAVNNSGYRYY